MRKKTIQLWGLSALFIFLNFSTLAQNKTVTGTVKDKDGAGVAGASVTVKGSTTGTNTSSTGTFSLNVPASAKMLVVTYVGYASREVPIGTGPVEIVLAESTTSDLNEVVVVGYGTTRKKDLTGAVTSVQAKDFNNGQINSPQQLLQGKVAGLQIINSSGQPGGITIVKIRGNNSIRAGNTPLYVVDGIPLDGRSPRPGFNPSGIGTTPGGDPLTFINPSEISSIEVLKDASASAIYGSRGANGVIILTTKKGVSGPAKVEAGASLGFSDIMRKVDVLDAGGYRKALEQFDAPRSDSGSSIDPFKEILRSSFTQNYSLALSGGTDNGKYRASFFTSDQDGIIKKTNLKKYVGNFNGQFKFLDKRLSLDFSGTAANVVEQIAPISNDAGSGGNLISLALIWNPTLPLIRSNGMYNQDNPSGQVNPLALSHAYNDFINITTLLANIRASYKITDWLEYAILYGLNYGVGTRKGELQGFIARTGGDADGKGIAAVLEDQLNSNTITHTLTFNKDISSNFSLNALAGYEYWKTNYKGSGSVVSQFDYNVQQDKLLPIHYYDNMAAGNRANLQTFSFREPVTEISSYFARAILNYNDRYILTGTFRADGSSKFGKDNKYAYFPSMAASWNIHNEEFMKDNNIFEALKFRVGYGETGNQEFASDAALDVYRYSGFGSTTSPHFGNAGLKWETVTAVNVGIDFTVFKGRLNGTIDYFNKITHDPLFLTVISQPTAGSGAIFTNLNGAEVANRGVEVALGASIIRKENLTWDVNANATFVKNEFTFAPAGTVPLAFTGQLHGQGTSGAYAQAIANDQPLNVYYLPRFLGFDKDGIGTYSATPEYVGDPNPTTYVGFATTLTIKKFEFNIGMHGSFGNKIYNNTAMSVLNIANINGGRNIAAGLVNAGENPANAITPSTRFLENGGYLKMNNASVKYNFGSVGKYLKNLSVYVSANNLFVITKYKGFDPEVNVDKNINGIPSLAIDYIGYPTQRTFLFGFNFAL